MYSTHAKRSRRKKLWVKRERSGVRRERSGVKRERSGVKRERSRRNPAQVTLNFAYYFDLFTLTDYNHLTAASGDPGTKGLSETLTPNPKPQPLNSKFQIPIPKRFVF